MFRKREILDVGVSRRILWIGSAAYPLQNIARAQAIEIAPNRARAIRHYIAQVVIWLALGAGAVVAIDIVEIPVAVDPDQLRRLASYVVFALVSISTIRVLVTLFTRTYYAMIIETAGNPQTALVSTDKREVSSLVRKTMDAIDNPAAEFHQQVQNITNIGEQYNLSGRHNIGKRVSA
jgi:hypothetical protein